MIADLNGETDVSPSRFVQFKEAVKALFHLTAEGVEHLNRETALPTPTASQEHRTEEQHS